MNYLKLYKNIINIAKNRQITEDTYSEKHHIIPKSIYNNSFAYTLLNDYNIIAKESKLNIIRLLPKEHLIVHILLPKIFKNINTDAYEKMLFAFNIMSNRYGGSRTYRVLREEYSKMLTKTRTGKPSGMAGKKWSKERHAIGNLNKGKTYEEIYGIEKAQELKESRSLNRKDKTFQQFYGIDKANEIKNKLQKVVHTKMWNEKISKAKIGIAMSEEQKKKISTFMSDHDKNPCVNQTLYTFKNINTGEIVQKRPIDMKKEYGCNGISAVMCGKRNHNNGWSLVVDNPTKG